MSLDQQVSENRNWINSVIQASKLASELSESASITSANETVNIQQGVADAKFVKIPIIRGSLGAYNPVTNTPSLADGTGVSGDSYEVSIAGVRNLGSGNISFIEEDFVLYNGSKWIKTTKSQISDILGLRAELDSLAVANLKISINGNSFKLLKYPGNVLNSLEVNDFAIDGFYDTTEIWDKAKYLGGNKDLKASWTVIEYTEL
tara:strand:- start:680 stop:1291 length:612 start_codon:yes stop_codon:yes gene_type:complete